MNRRALNNSILVLSLVANIVIIGLYLHARKRPLAPMAPALPVPAKAGPKILINTSNFDFSDTKLSDESWKIPAPDTQPPPAPDAPLNIEIK